jgi:histidinol-phosphate/aromatic aminotransferase/cobyric acid decarboxylase-like protein
MTKLGAEVFPSYANFMLARFPAGMVNDQGGRKGIWSQMVDQGIYIRNKSVMYPDTDLCHDMLRLSPGPMPGARRYIGALTNVMKGFK